LTDARGQREGFEEKRVNVIRQIACWFADLAISFVAGPTLSARAQILA
jgi:hypothetical protein